MATAHCTRNRTTDQTLNRHQRYYRENRHRILEQKRQQKTADPQAIQDRERENSLKRKYGMTLQAYEELVTTQNGTCAICGKPERAIQRGRPKPLSVDHDHSTGRVRGLLCTKCNVAIGSLDDDPELCKKAADYLK